MALRPKKSTTSSKKLGPLKRRPSLFFIYQSRASAFDPLVQFSVSDLAKFKHFLHRHRLLFPASLKEQGEGNITLHAFIQKEGEVLEYNPKMGSPEPSHLMLLKPGDVKVIIEDMAGCRPIQTRHHMEQGRLSGTRLSHNGQGVTGRNPHLPKNPGLSPAIFPLHPPAK